MSKRKELLLPVLIGCFLAWLGYASAAERQQFVIHASGEDILVETFLSRSGESPPAVIVLSGSRGFAATAYDEIGASFAAAGLDTFLVHVLSPADLNAIAGAGSAEARIRYYERRLTQWTASVLTVAAHLNAKPGYSGRIGIMGISLGAQIASAATANRQDVAALVLVDGGLPNGYEEPLASLPPLRLIWGGADRTFPPAIAQALQKTVQGLGGSAELDIYPGGAHDFFLKPGSEQAAEARRSAADFLTGQLQSTHP
ncbi:dienelactone hydrolase family protein [Devosia sp. LjRoot16]|uniref:dienelactone hydrolase family protein n=1 Tax=Devosia sp. LjRoot16 TaxID=3342271 RepID=UPI003ED0277F